MRVPLLRPQYFNAHLARVAGIPEDVEERGTRSAKKRRTHIEGQTKVVVLLTAIKGDDSVMSFVSLRAR